MGVLAEFERAMIAERGRAGLRGPRVRVSASGARRLPLRGPPQLAAVYLRDLIPHRASLAAAVRVLTVVALAPLVATALLTRDRTAIVSFDRGSHHAAVSPWADRDAAWADTDGDV